MRRSPARSRTGHATIGDTFLDSAKLAPPCHALSSLSMSPFGQCGSGTRTRTCATTATFLDRTQLALPCRDSHYLDMSDLAVAALRPGIEPGCTSPPWGRSSYLCARQPFHCHGFAFRGRPPPVQAGTPLTVRPGQVDGTPRGVAIIWRYPLNSVLKHLCHRCDRTPVGPSLNPGRVLQGAIACRY